MLPVALLLATGCKQQPVQQTGYDEPKWVNEYTIKDNEVKGIGIAKRHINGPQAQRKAAVSKAIDEIASQLGTTVSSVVQSKVETHNKSASKEMSAYSIQTVDGKKIQARIMKSYKNKKGVLYILMVGKIK